MWAGSFLRVRASKARFSPGGCRFPWETDVVGTLFEVEESPGAPGEFAADVEDEEDDDGCASAAKPCFTSAVWGLVLRRALY